MAERIQLKRKKGWRKPSGAVVVSRPSKWGNPFSTRDGLTVDDACCLYEEWLTGEMDECDMVRMPNGEWVEVPERPPWTDILELRGKDLCCWCPLDKPCHADVLLELANNPAEATRLGLLASKGDPGACRAERAGATNTEAT